MKIEAVFLVKAGTLPTFDLSKLHRYRANLFSLFLSFFFFPLIIKANIHAQNSGSEFCESYDRYIAGIRVFFLPFSGLEIKRVFARMAI